MGKMIDNFGVVALGLHQDFLCLKGPLPIPAMHSAPYMVRKVVLHHGEEAPSSSWETRGAGR